MKYTVVKRQHMNCSLERAFPYIVLDAQGKVLQYVKTEQRAHEWALEHGYTKEL